MANKPLHVIEDAAKIRRILQASAKDILLALDRANREAAKPILQKSKDFVPNETLSQWMKYGWSRRGDGQNALAWDKTEIEKGMLFRAGTKSKYSDYRALLQFKNTSGTGAIFEMAGRGKFQGKTPQGKAFVRNLDKKFPRKSRLIWRAADEVGLQILRQKIIDNYEVARKELQARIDRGGK